MKVDLYEALNLEFPPGNTKIVQKLRKLNTLRNSLAHNLNAEINEKDIIPFLNGVKTSKKISTLEMLKRALKYFIGYFHAQISMDEMCPFFSSYMRNEKKFNNDVGWNPLLLWVNYKLPNLRKLIKFMKIK